jgi:hypothetical protein
MAIPGPRGAARFRLIHSDAVLGLGIEGAYWVEPGRLMAGSYPGDHDRALARRQLRGLLDRGIRTFVNLMEAVEEGQDSRTPAAYGHLLRQVAGTAALECHCLRFGIPDYTAPDHAYLHKILSAIRASIERDRPVYVHCWRGRGRTGTVVGAYLIERGIATPANFLAVMQTLREPHGLEGASPETPDQIETVRRYRVPRPRA